MVQLSEMKNFLSSSARRVLNRLQPITRRHSHRNPISDLFPWIVTHDFDTCFQSHDISSLFSPSSLNFSSNCLLVVFDSNGIEILRVSLPLQSLLKTPIYFSHLLRSSSFEYGTFAILHNSNPHVFVDKPFVLTDRWYVSFNNRLSDLRHYVHGNYDAVTLTNQGSIICLGGSSFLPRSYHFQYLFDSDFCYDLFFTNPSSSSK